MLDQPAITRSRYVTSGPPSVVTLTIKSPAPNSITPTATTAVSGTTAPGAKVDIAASQPGSQDNTTSMTETAANGQGDYSATIPTPPGTTVITAAAAAATASRSTGWAQETVTAAYSNVPDAYNNVGITDNSNTTPGDFDGVGDSYSAQALASATPNALTPGSTITVDGVTMTWPNVAAGQPDNVVAEGQSFDVSGTGSTLGLLGGAAFGTATGVGVFTGCTCSRSGSAADSDSRRPPRTRHISRRGSMR